MKIMHLEVPRVFYGVRQSEQRVARACDPVLKVNDERTLTELPLMVTCARCKLTRVYKTAFAGEAVA